MNEGGPFENMPKGYEVQKHEDGYYIYREEKPPIDPNDPGFNTSRHPVAIVPITVTTGEEIFSTVEREAWRLEAQRWQEKYTGLLMLNWEKRALDWQRESGVWKQAFTDLKDKFTSMRDHAADLQEKLDARNAADNLRDDKITQEKAQSLKRDDSR